MIGSHAGCFARACVGVVLAVVVAGCGGQPVPPDGTVTGRNHTPEWTQWMPGTTTCTKYGCTTTPGYPIFHPESWGVEVTATHNPDWKGTVGVNEDVYNRCQQGALWPQCSKENTR